MLKLFKGILVAAVCVGLFGCGHKNPLINEDYISYFKGNLFNDDSDYPIRQCASYFASGKNPELKTKCDKWSEKNYHSALNMGAIPSSTTLDDYRDPELWKLVVPK